MTINWRRIALAVGAPLIAIAFALLVTSLVLTLRSLQRRFARGPVLAS